MTDDEKLFHRREADIVQAVIDSVKVLEPFHSRPVKKGGDVLFGWLWAIQRQDISPEIAEQQLRERTMQLLKALRSRFWLLQDLATPRAAVILHVGLLIGAERLVALQELWEALARHDYDTAQDVLLLNGWAEVTGQDPHARRRTLALARMLRTGEPPKGRLQ